MNGVLTILKRFSPYLFFAFFIAFFCSIFGGVLRTAAKNRKKCLMKTWHFFRFLAACYALAAKNRKKCFNKKIVGKHISEGRATISANIFNLVNTVPLTEAYLGVKRKRFIHQVSFLRMINYMYSKCVSIHLNASQ